ncbi:hypothetical protein Hrubri_4368 [Herbaspirillum rubrisubalbicans M1]|uniref:DUF4238 domain-containing protein n=1 Tax=Herbaspirillum rubrisubalbicans TaxID=80842 RepID=UPI00073A0784|nr:DUF4238 domain-containing protein [Herbaspirillum rubrisubalbicans]ALU91513.1 hypothetical protein Hrubri_4368 [Herbaspirillum rubrisubalbicans M1]
MKAKEAYANQHIVAEKYLAAWQNEKTGKLVEFKRLPGDGFRPKKVGAGGTGFIRHIYSIKNQEAGPDGSAVTTYDTYLEKEFFTAEIDSPIGVVLKHIRETKSVKNLGSKEKRLWAKFLVAQHLRVPRKLEQNATKGAIHFLQLKQQQMLAGPAPTSDEDWQKRRQFVAETLAMHEQEGENNSKHALPYAINSPAALEPILNSHWEVMDLSHILDTFIIGDHPVVWNNDYGKLFSILLPLSPHLLFLATNSSKEYLDVHQMPQKDLVREFNLEQAKSARKYVWACDDSNEELVRRYLPKRPWSFKKQNEMTVATEVSRA